jgi:radical SAM protein with 4Fe4S-binding SPASM domain
MSLSQADFLIKKFEEIMKDRWFSINFTGIIVAFWGGEPTLNMKFIDRFLNHFIDDDRVSFFLYTNAVNIDGYLDRLIYLKDKRLPDGREKFRLQASYDGEPINSRNRLTPGGKPSTGKVLENLQTLKKYGLLKGVKSTLRIEDLKFLPQAYRDVKELCPEGTYVPSIDMTELSFEGFNHQNLYNILMEIKDEELEFFRKNGRYFLSWFNKKGEGKNARKVCGFSKMLTVEQNGDLLLCHGCGYNEEVKKELKVSNISSPNLLRDIKKHGEEVSYKNLVDNLHDDCKKCDVNHCVLCHVEGHKTSKKDGLVPKLMDIPENKFMCEFWRTVDKFRQENLYK